MNAFIVPGVPKLEKRTFKSDNAAIKAAKKFNVDKILSVELVPQVKSEILVSEFKSKHQLWLEKCQSKRDARALKKATRLAAREERKAIRLADRAKKKADRELQRKQRVAAKAIIADTSKANKKAEVPAPTVKEVKKSSSTATTSAPKTIKPAAKPTARPSRPTQDVMVCSFLLFFTRPDGEETFR